MNKILIVFGQRPELIKMAPMRNLSKDGKYIDSICGWKS